MNKNDGYVLIDAIIVLLILSLGLTSNYNLIIKTLKFENNINKNISLVLERSINYDQKIKNILEE